MEDQSQLIIPTAEPKMKIPIVNIETPNISGLPDNIKNEIELSSMPVYTIEKGNINTLSNLREQIIDEPIEYRPTKFMKDVDSVRKSELGADPLPFNNEYASNEDTPITQKGKMSEEEMEALKEDQTARTLMKTVDLDKPKEEQPEVVGVDKTGGIPPRNSFADNSVVSGNLDQEYHSKHHRDKDLERNDEIYTHPYEREQFREHGTSPDFDHDRYMTRSEKVQASQHSSNKRYRPRNLMSNSYPKQRISDGESDFHRPVSEIDAFDRDSDRDKFSDYEHYDNNGDEGGEQEGTLIKNVDFLLFDIFLTIFSIPRNIDF